jgi:hypothetical protein
LIFNYQKENVLKIIAFLLVLSFLTIALGAQDSAEEQAENNKDVTLTSGLLLQVSTLPEAKLSFTHRITFPFLQGNSPFTANNNLAFAFACEVSPISVNGLAEAIWTPIAFLELSAGGRMGSGWPLNLLGNDIYGIGLNQPGFFCKSVYNGKAFDGLLWKAQAGGAVQFDLAAIFPGEWNHVIGRSYHEINYKGYTRAKTGQSWYFEGDEGENINGFNYYGNLLIGYQMPIFLNLVGLLAEMDLYLYDTPGRKRWGDDIIRWTFSGIFSFTITEKIGVALLAQFRTRRNFVEPYWRDLYYQYRTVNYSNPLRLEFYRVAAAITYQF